MPGSYQALPVDTCKTSVLGIGNCSFVLRVIRCWCLAAVRVILARMNPPPERYVTLGMYAFTEAQQSAWRQLLDRFCQISDAGRAGISLSFDHDPALLLESGLWFGHTCGYPLMTRLQDHVSPFCVPLFDVPGTDGKYYSSRIIVADGSGIETIADSRGSVAAMNNLDSNSGMNVLRHAVAEVRDRKQPCSEPFFASVITSGGHLQSLQAVASGAADIAAIDCVSLQLIADWRPQLCAGVRVIADSVKTCGLPLVMSNSDMVNADTGLMTENLNRALDSCNDAVRSTLHLNGFVGVQLDDYQSILEVEQFAIERGYPELN